MNSSVKKVVTKALICGISVAALGIGGAEWLLPKLENSVAAQGRSGVATADGVAGALTKLREYNQVNKQANLLGFSCWEEKDSCQAMIDRVGKNQELAAAFLGAKEVRASVYLKKEFFVFLPNRLLYINQAATDQEIIDFLH